MLKKAAALAALFILSMLPAVAAEPKTEPPLKITVESSRKSHLVRVNEPFEFIIRADKPQKVNVVLSLDGEAVLKELTVTPPARIPAVLNPALRIPAGTASSGRVHAAGFRIRLKNLICPRSIGFPFG